MNARKTIEIKIKKCSFPLKHSVPYDEITIKILINLNSKSRDTHKQLNTKFDPHLIGVSADPLM